VCLKLPPAFRGIIIMECNECGEQGEDFVDVDGDDEFEGERKYACSDECLNAILGRM